MRSSILGAALSAATLRVAAAQGGDFNVLTMNVAGLPAILNGNEVPGDKATNAGTIGSLFAKYGYDVINVQEDFAYHAYIYAKDNHPFRTPTSGTVIVGDGMNTLSNFDSINFTRNRWATCSNASGADCLTPKGFTFMRMQVADGVFVDFYNLHADAGTETDDERARTANIQQVADYVNTWSKGNAVVVMGDTNSRYSRTADNIDVLRTQAGLTDAWVQLERGNVVPTVETLCDNPSRNNSCETVDKVFYRASAIVGLTATAFNYESTKFLQSDGSILSDHNPISVNFTYSVSNKLRQSAFRGGPHGNWFSDLPALAAKTKPTARTLTFRGDNRLDAVAVTLADGTTFSHGGTGGTAASLTLGTGEFWTQATLCQDKYNDTTRNFYIKATTSAGKTLEVGKTTGDCGTFTAPAGWQIVGFMGQDGDGVDQLAFIYAPR